MYSYDAVIMIGKGKVCIWAKWPIRPVLISGFCGMKRLGVFLPPMSPPGLEPELLDLNMSTLTTAPSTGNHDTVPT